MKKELKQALAQIKEVAKTAGTAGEGRTSAFAQLLVETIEPNHITLDVFNAFMPTRQLNIGDAIVKKVRRTGHPVRTLVPGVEILSDPFYPAKENITYNLEYMVTAMRMNLWELQSGELGTLEFFRSEMEKALVDELVARVYSLVGSVWNGLTSRTNYVDATSTGLTTEIMDNMIETVLYRAGNIRAIVGTRSALLPLYKTGGIVEYTPQVSQNTNGVIAVPEILLEWRRTGKLATWRGIPIIEIPQVFQRTFNNFDKPLIDTSRVLVIGDNAGEVVLYGGVESQEYTDMRVVPADYQLALYRRYGLIIDMIENIGVIKVNGAPNVPYSINWPLAGQ